MARNSGQWKPGSFTKNFSWGDRSDGLLQLYESIRLGFANIMQDTPRSEFRRRVQGADRPDYIPINFFLFNKTIDGIDYLVADELVFQALFHEHSARFDKLALFAFNFSFAGRWTGATADQRWPALWAFHYIRDRVAKQLSWNTTQVSAADIEKFLQDDSRYKAKTTRKISTNLNYLYLIGHLAEFSERRVERWWVDSLFLALDRLIEDRRLDGIETNESQYATVLSQSDFAAISGQSSLEKNLAAMHLIALYIACGGRDRFSDEEVRARTEIRLPDIEWFVANDSRPVGAIHPTNARILKTIPRACAMLARYAAGFSIIDADELATFNAEEFIRNQTQRALDRLREENITPAMSAEELMRLTRNR